MYPVSTAPFGNPAWLGLLLLIGPPLATFLTGFRKRIQTASLTILVASALYALANGSLEEILWRGTYVSVFPDDWFFGYLYPAIWFGLWHISPQVVYPSPMGSLPFALMAILLGLVWGFIAMTTGSILWVVVAHVLLNFAGLTGFSFLRSPNPGD